jgi:hypothetical protein
MTGRTLHVNDRSGATLFERRLRRRTLVLGEASEGAVEAPSD